MPNNRLGGLAGLAAVAAGIARVARPGGRLCAGPARGPWPLDPG
jgi:hypothetical protein